MQVMRYGKQDKLIRHLKMEDFKVFFTLILCAGRSLLQQRIQGTHVRIFGGVPI